MLATQILLGRHDFQSGAALEVARREYARRHDVFTLDCYAWALHVNGQNEEALKQIETALAVGIRDAWLNDRLGMQMMAGPQQWQAVARLRRDPHDPTSACWLHGPSFCLSR